jgi:hypothetical protein
MAYFRPFSNVISTKTSRAARKKYLQHGGDHRWRHGWRHVQVLYSLILIWIFHWNNSNIGDLISVNFYLSPARANNVHKLTIWKQPLDLKTVWKITRSYHEIYYLLGVWLNKWQLAPWRRSLVSVTGLLPGTWRTGREPVPASTVLLTARTEKVTTVSDPVRKTNKFIKTIGD